jgi:hypothetical protein
MDRNKLDQLMKNDVRVKALMEDIVEDFVNFEKSASHLDQEISTKDLLSITDTKLEDVKSIKNNIVILKDKEFVDSVEQDYLPNSADECYCITFDYDEWKRTTEQICIEFNNQDRIQYKIEPLLELDVLKKVKYFMDKPNAILNGTPIFAKTLRFKSLDSLEFFISKNVSKIVVCDCYTPVSSKENFILTCALL